MFLKLSKALYVRLNPDDVSITIPGPVVRATKEIISQVGIGASNLVITGTLGAAGRLLLPQVKAATVIAVYTTFKIV